MSRAKPTTVMISDLVDLKDPDKRTYRQINHATPHLIPVGTLVECKWDAWLGAGMSWKVHARLRVLLHDRDCNGTPLYTLGQWYPYAAKTGGFHGFSEDALTVVEETDEALTWEEGES